MTKNRVRYFEVRINYKPTYIFFLVKNKKKQMLNYTERTFVVHYKYYKYL